MSRATQHNPPFLLGNLPDQITKFDDQPFAELITELFTKAIMLDNEYLYAENAIELKTERLKTNLKEISPNDYSNLISLYSDPRFIIILSLLQARIESDPNTSTKFFDSFYSNLTTTTEEKIQLQTSFSHTHAQIWALFCCTDERSILGLLIKLESEKPKHSNTNLALEKLQVTKELISQNSSEFLRALEDPHNQSRTSEFQLADNIIRNFLASINANIELKISEIFNYIFQSHEEHAATKSREDSQPFSYQLFIYDILFENHTVRGFLRTMIPSQVSTDWLDTFFYNFILTQKALTAKIEKLSSTLDSSFSTNSHSLQKGLEKFSGRAIPILSAIRSALNEISINHNYQSAFRNDANLARALSKIFAPYFEKLRISENRERVDEGQLRDTFIQTMSNDDDDHNESAAQTLATPILNAYLDTEGKTHRALPTSKSTVAFSLKPRPKPPEKDPSAFESFCMLFPCYRNKKEKEHQANNSTISIRKATHTH